MTCALSPCVLAQCRSQQHGRRRRAAAATRSAPRRGSYEDLKDDSATAILAALAAAARPLGRGDLLVATGIPASRWNVAIRRLVESGRVVRTGVKRGTRYSLP